MSQQKQCLRCGELLDSEVRFCTRCGADQYAAPGAPGTGPGSATGPYEAPGTGYPPPGGMAKPKNWFVESILATICCCNPLGIVAIVFAVKVDGLANRGDYQGAVDAANKAKLFFILTIVLGFVGNAAFTIYKWPQMMEDIQKEMDKQKQEQTQPSTDIQIPTQ